MMSNEPEPQRVPHTTRNCEVMHHHQELPGNDGWHAHPAGGQMLWHQHGVITMYRQPLVSDAEVEPTAVSQLEYAHRLLEQAYDAVRQAQKLLPDGVHQGVNEAQLNFAMEDTQAAGAQVDEALGRIRQGK